MPFHPVANVVKIQIQGTSSELNWANVLHFVYGGAPPTLASVTGAAEQVFNAYVAQIIPIMATVTTVDQVVVTDLSSASSNVGEFGTSTPGSSGGEKLPASVAVLADYPVSLRYRGGHPRTYIFAGVQADLQDQSTWTTEFVSTTEDAWDNVFNALLGSTIDGTTYTGPAAVSYVTDHAPRETPLVLALSSFNISNRVASQRRRMRRRT